MQLGGYRPHQNRESAALQFRVSLVPVRVRVSVVHHVPSLNLARERGKKYTRAVQCDSVRY